MNRPRVLGIGLGSRARSSSGVASAFALSVALTSSAAGGCGGARGAGSSAASVPSVAPAVQPESVVFVEDDYARAVAKAKSEHKLLFVDAWAPWCHSCISMKTGVLSDPRLSTLDRQFVWLAVDTEKPVNAAFVEKFPLEAWPTFYVIDPATQTPRLKWAGTATLDELTALLEGAREERGGDGSTGGGAGASFVAGTRAAAADKPEEAFAAFEAARKSLTAPSMLGARIVEAELSLLMRRDPGRCLEIGVVAIEPLPAGTSKATALTTALSCADALREQKKPANVGRLVEVGKALLDPSSGVMAADDRSGIYEALVEEAKSRGDAVEAKALAAQWARFLEREAAATSSPEARSVFDGHRLLAYDAIGELDRALPMLTATAHDLPRDYNAHARLAWVHLQQKRFAQGLVEADLALALAYGPRKLRIYKTKVDLLIAKGDKVAAKQCLDEAFTFAATLPAGQGKGNLAELEKRRAKLAL